MKYLIVFLLLILFFPLHSQSKKELKNSYHAKVYLVEREIVQGTFSNCTDSSIVIIDFEARDTIHMPIQTIYKLEIRKKNSAKRNTLLGALVGFGVGFGVGWSEYDLPGSATIDQGGHALGAGIIGGFVGAFVGNLSSKFNKSYYIRGKMKEYNRVRDNLAQYSLPQRH
jgi:hypothetical protein